MDVPSFSWFVCNQFLDVVVALVTGNGPHSIHGSAVVFAMTVAAGLVTIGEKFPKQGEIIVMKILALSCSLFSVDAASFQRLDEGVACRAEYLLIIDDMGAVLVAVLIVTEETIALPDKAVFEGFRDQ
jgi:hypothetical protein